MFANLACGGDDSHRTANARAEAAQPTESAQLAEEGDWRLVEDLRIDGTRELFSLPSGFLLVQKDGGMIFADPVGYNLRVYDAAGRHRFDFGRRGEGPGEFLGSARVTNLSGGLVGDTVWVYDPIGRRFTYLDAEGRFIRTASAPRLADVLVAGSAGAFPAEFTPLAVYGDGRMIGRRRVTISRAMSEYRHDVVVLEPGSSIARTLVAQNASRMKTLVDQSTGASYSFPAAGGAPTVVGVAQDGSRIAILQKADATSGIWSLVVLDSRGDTILTRNVPVDSIQGGDDSTEPQHLEEILNSLRAQNVRRTLYTSAFIDRVERALREEARAQRGASITSVRVGLDGAVWLAFRSPPDGSRSFLMLDANGGVIGRVVAALNGARYPLVPGAVSREHLWALVGDSDGVPSIVRYRVVRN